MGALSANLQVTAGQLPAGVCYDHDENARLQAYAERLIVSLSAQYATFQYGDVAPTSDLGPWFNTSDNNWYVWDNSSGSYIVLAPAAVTGQVPVGFVGAWSGAIATVATFFNTTGGEWRHCDGTAISRTVYSLLFGIIGTQYGVGDGVTTFNIPNLRDVMIAGAKVDDAGTAKTSIADPALTALLKSRAYIDHTHRLTGAGPSLITGGGANSVGGGVTMASTDGAQVSERVLPAFMAMAYVIRIL